MKRSPKSDAGSPISERPAALVRRAVARLRHLRRRPPADPQPQPVHWPVEHLRDLRPLKDVNLEDGPIHHD